MNLIDLLEAVYFRPYRVESSDAWVGHIPFASWLVHTLKPSVIVELGTYSGNSYLAFCQSVKENKLSTLCYAVDTWRGDEHGGFYGEEIYQALNEYHEKRYSNFSRMLRMTFDEASSYFAEKSIDLLHIDGLHTYSAVKHDFETWLPKLSPHAVVIFHDINVRERGFGVWRFWNELIKQYPLNFDFIHSNGLGVLQLSSGKGSFNVEWLRQDNKNRQIIRELFANLGQGAIDNYRLQEMGRSLKIVSSTADKYIAEINTARLVIAERDQKIKDQDQEIRDQDQRISDRDQEIRDQDQRISDRDQKIVSLQEYMVGREQILQDLNSKLLEIYSSTAWKLIQQIWKIRVFLAPRNSLRERLGKRLINVFKKTATINSHPSRSLEFNTELYRKKPLNKQHWVVMATEHTLFVAYLVTERLRTHGCKVQITTTSPADYSSDYYVVVCPQMFQSLPPAEKRISFQMEQSVSSRWFTADYLKTLHDSLAILDYSLNNIEFLDRKGIGYPQVYYLPIGASTNYGTQAPESRKKYDILFYGDGKSSPRRLKMLHALQKEFNVKVVSEVFGPELLKMIKQAKFVINIHYYENALLEIPRIQECLSLGVPVISEATQNHDDYPELAGAVRFFEQGSISNMLRTVKTALDKGISRKQVLSAAQKSDQRFAFMFDRFLMGMGFLPSSYIQNLPVPDISSQMVLSLPETITRRCNFQEICPEGFSFFEGLRWNPGWIGCGLSYTALAKKALEMGMKRLSVMEDDTLPPEDFQLQNKSIHEFLDLYEGQWDIFAGFIADLHPNVKILDIRMYKGMRFVTINKMTSTVFNIYNTRALQLLAHWDPDNLDVQSNTIDRYLENQNNLRVVLVLPYLVGHNEQESSTIWGFQNTEYREMVMSSKQKLQKLIRDYELNNH